ncbi:MAG: hypothetical protein ACOC12_00055 [Bacteroidota bacterium]
MEDIIYIILAIVWLVISILGGMKKKQTKPPQQQTSRPQPRPLEADPAPQKEKSDFEELLEDFFGTETDTQERPAQPQRAPQPSYPQEFKTKEEEPQSTFYEEQSDPEIEKYQGADVVTENYEFAAEGKMETLEDLIRSYEQSERKTLEEDSKIAVEDLDEGFVGRKDFEFDVRKAIIYSEIINRKYT